MTVDDFIESLVQNGLVAADDLHAALAQSPPQSAADPTDVAGCLVTAGLLTPFQAEVALHGQAGELTLGNYLLVDRLGQGGMGQVFRARHRRMDRIVALKTLTPDLVRHPEALERFHREVKAAARLTHPNIVTAHDADEANGVHFLVMEYAAGCDLDTVLQRCGPLSQADLLQVVLQAARGLDYAHSKGVIHRDIKPPNLMLTTEGVVKVLDMGLARLAEKGLESFTQTNYIFGSVDYMPPEQAESARRADHRSDIYALGCTLYTLATGQAIYDGESNIQKFLNHREAPIPDLTVEGREPPLQLLALYRSMVAKQPDERCQSMGEVVAAIEMLSPAGDLRPLIARARGEDEPTADPWAKTVRPAGTPLATGRQRPPLLPTKAGKAGSTRQVKPSTAANQQDLPSAWDSQPPRPAPAARDLPGGRAPSTHRPTADGTVGTVADARQAEWLEDAVAAQPARVAKPAGGIDQQTLLIAGAGLAGFVLVGILLFVVGAQNRALADRSPDANQPPATNTGTTPSIPPTTTSPPPPTVKIEIPLPPFPPPKELPKFEPPKADPVQPEPPKKLDPPHTDPPKQAEPPGGDPPKLDPLPGPVDVLKLLDVERNGVGKKSWQSAGAGLPWVSRNGTRIPTPRPPDQEGSGFLLPVTLTPSYDLTLAAEHLGDFGPLLVGIPRGEDDWSLIILDGPPPEGPGGPGGPFGPEKGPGKKGSFPKIGRVRPEGGGLGPPPADVMLDGKANVVIKVRPSGITCNNVTIGPASQNSPLYPILLLAEKRTILVASLGNYRLSKLEYTPVAR